MTPAKLIIAFLLNLAVFPGSGQMYLKEKKRGYACAFVTAVLLVVFTLHFSNLFAKEMQDPEMLVVGQQIATQADRDFYQLMNLAKPISDKFFAKHETVFNIYLFLAGAFYIAMSADLVLIYMDRRAGSSPRG